MENQGTKGKRTRTRMNYSPDQLSAMEVVFEQTQYPDVKVLSTLSHKLQIPVEKVCTWFQNRRSKFRRASKNGHISWMRQQIFKTDEKKPGKVKAVDGNANVIHQVPPQVATSPNSDVGSVQDCSLNQARFRQHQFPSPYPLPLPSQPNPVVFPGQMPAYAMTMHTQQSALGCYSNDPLFQPQWYPARNDAAASQHVECYYTSAENRQTTWNQTGSPGVSQGNDGSSSLY